MGVWGLPFVCLLPPALLCSCSWAFCAALLASDQHLTLAARKLTCCCMPAAAPVDAAAAAAADGQLPLFVGEGAAGGALLAVDDVDDEVRAAAAILSSRPC